MSEAGLEMKTLKLSQETHDDLRTPFVWNRPRARLYDYHNEIGGLYYQPMIRYIQSREAGGMRQIVQVPDRIQSNFDRIVYRRKPTEEDLQDFLTTYYARRLKDVNSKTVHVKNELMRWSKDPKSLNMVRGSANVRDRYLCKLQLLHTEKQAAEARRRADAGEIGEIDLEGDDDCPVIHFGKEEVDVDKYEPGYEKMVEDRRQIRLEKEMRKREYYAIDKAMKERMASIMDRTKLLAKMENKLSSEDSKNIETKMTSSVKNLESDMTSNIQNMESNMTKKITIKSYHQEGDGEQISQYFKDNVADISTSGNYSSTEERKSDVSAIGNVEKRFERAARKANLYSRGQLDKPRVKYCLPRW